MVSSSAEFELDSGPLVLARISYVLTCRFKRRNSRSRPLQSCFKSRECWTLSALQALIVALQDAEIGICPHSLLFGNLATWSSAMGIALHTLIEAALSFRETECLEHGASTVSLVVPA